MAARKVKAEDFGDGTYQVAELGLVVNGKVVTEDPFKVADPEAKPAKTADEAPDATADSTPEA